MDEDDGESGDLTPAQVRAERWRQVGRVLRHRSPEIFEAIVALAEAAASEIPRPSVAIDEISRDA